MILGGSDLKSVLFKAFLACFPGMLSLAALSIDSGWTQGTLPSLESSFSSSVPAMTPISELMSPSTQTSESVSAKTSSITTPSAPMTESKSATKPLSAQKLPLKPATLQKSLQIDKKPETAVDKPAEKAESSISTPVSQEGLAANTSPQKQKLVVPILNRYGLNPFEAKKKLLPVSYSPLQGIVIFPVIKHGKDKAFGDLPLIFAREYAQKLELQVPETKVYHPIYTVDELRMQGLGHIYDQVMDYYLKAGRPEPAAMSYLVKQLDKNNANISRVIFVEADLDASHPTMATGPLERIKGLMTDGTPQQMKYFVHSRVQVFDAEKPEFPMVWGGSWGRSIKTDQFYNVTTSVFADSDSHQSFSRLCRQMSREMLYITPKDAYMAPQYTDLSVEGKLVSGKEHQIPNFMETKQSRNQLNVENRQAIQRILQRQNSLGP